MIRRPETRGPALVLGWLVLFGAGCDHAPQESPTSGRIRIAVAESHAPLLRREADRFESLYPQARVAVQATTTREAFVALLADSVQLAVVDRAPNDEERRAIAASGASIETLRIAEDALALLVNAASGLESVSLEQLDDLVRGRIVDWREVAGSQRSGPVRIVATGRNSGAWELLAMQFFPGADLTRVVDLAPTQAEVIVRVASDPAAIGIVSVAAWRDPGTTPRPQVQVAAAPGWSRGVAEPAGANVRALGVAGRDSLGDVAVHALHQANIHLGTYPLHYPVYVCFETRSRLALGFSAFVGSGPGQQCILDAGLVPATMPVRLVQLQ